MPPVSAKRQWTLHAVVQGWLCEKACIMPRRRSTAQRFSAPLSGGLGAGAGKLLGAVILELEWPATLQRWTGGVHGGVR